MRTFELIVEICPNRFQRISDRIKPNHEIGRMRLALCESQSDAEQITKTNPWLSRVIFDVSHENSSLFPDLALDSILERFSRFYETRQC
jgi:hypothetical protein